MTTVASCILMAHNFFIQKKVEKSRESKSSVKEKVRKAASGLGFPVFSLSMEKRMVFGPQQ